MKTSSTIVCCLLLASFGYFVATSNTPSSNTIVAEPIAPKPLNEVCATVTKHDTTTVRDTVKVPETKVITKKVVKVKRVTHTVRDTIPILYIKTREGRKETPPDSIPAHIKYVVKEAHELN